MSAKLRIEIFPADIERSLSFFQQLGFTVGRRQDENPTYASIVRGEVRCGLLDSAPVDSDWRAFPAMTEIVIEVDDFVAYHDHVLGTGLPPSEPLQDRVWGLTDFRLTDPDGYYLQFTNRRA